MNIYKLNKNNISKIKDLYNTFKEKASTDFGFEVEPINFDLFKNTVIKNFNKGYFSENNEEITGLLLYTDKLNEAIELTLLLGENEQIKSKLLSTFMSDIKKEYKNKTISFPLLGKQKENETLLLNFQFDFVNQNILELDDLYSYNPCLPEKYELSTWQEKFITDIIKIIQENFSLLNDSKFDPRFLTFIGCKNIVELITKGILGEFLPDITTVLLYNDEPIGICFVNNSSAKTANIPILALSKKHQGKNLGEIMVKNSLSKLFAKNTRNKINVTCDSDNISAMKTYFNSGFRKIEDYKHFYLKI